MVVESMVGKWKNKIIKELNISMMTTLAQNQREGSPHVPEEGSSWQVEKPEATVDTFKSIAEQTQHWEHMETRVFVTHSDPYESTKTLKSLLNDLCQHGELVRAIQTLQRAWW